MFRKVSPLPLLGVTVFCTGCSPEEQQKVAEHVGGRIIDQMVEKDLPRFKAEIAPWQSQQLASALLFSAPPNACPCAAFAKQIVFFDDLMHQNFAKHHFGPKNDTPKQSFRRMKEAMLLLPLFASADTHKE